jgi:cytochrome c552
MMRPFAGVRNTENLLLPAAALAVAAGLAGGAFALSGAPAAERTVAIRPIQTPGGGYVSSDTCRACHPGEYASWHASFHRTMTQIAAPDTVATPFDGVTIEVIPGEPIRLDERGRELWAEFADPDDRPSSDPGRNGGAPGARITRQIVMTTGSHNQQIYWYATGGSRVLGQLPAIWLTGERRWIPRRAAIMSPPGAHVSETGAWNGVCIACHATNGQPRLDAPFGSRPAAALTADTRAAEFGIACEACHGPADAHVRANRNPLRRYALHFRVDARDETIVQPERLDPLRASQVCGQCHSFWEFADARAERTANASGLPYRPGDDLAATRFIVQPTRNLDTPIARAFVQADPGFVRDIFWSDGMIRATGREYNALLDSPCFRDAPDAAHTMTCFSCHTMHKAADDPRPAASWADQQLAPQGMDDAACVRCHTVADDHSHHRAGSPGRACANCHMPRTTYGLLKTIRSHQISSPSVQAALDTGRPDACSLCHLDKTLASTAAALEDWYGIAQPALGDDERGVAASLLWLLKGDAGQRAIVAQAMGWDAAQQASGSAWLAPYLAVTERDQYDAVRLIAARARRTLPPFRRDALPRASPQLLLTADGSFDAARVDRLVRERSNRRVVYRE